MYMLARGTDTSVGQQEVDILEGAPSTLQKARGHQPDVMCSMMEIVRDLQARIEVKKEVMKEEQHEHALRHGGGRNRMSLQVKRYVTSLTSPL
jgi:hypothetical protein